jgi:hypothetical protein
VTTDITAETPAQAQAAMAPVAVKPATAPVAVKPASAAERFTADVAKHEMTVLHDDGLYRHIRFKSPENGFYWFDLITWPGNLVISGDMETFAFARERDMCGFFRGQHVNPQYWAEKLRAPRPADVKVYSPDRFREHVMDTVKDAENDYPGLTAAAEEYFFGFGAEWNTEVEGDAVAGLQRFEYRPPDDEGEPFIFTDTWEWDLTDYSYQFLWCCHALLWGIAQYDKAKTAVPVD